MSSYHTIDGKEYPRVTSIIGQRAKPFLPPWYANMAIDYMNEHLNPEIEHIPVVEYAEIAIQARTAAVRKSEEAKEVGGLVHQYAHEFFTVGVSASPVPKTEFASAITAFHAWREKHSPSKVYSEIGVCDPDKKYAGICDFVGLVTVPKIRVKPLMLVIDFKCSPRIYEPDTKMQLAAYMYALERYNDFFRSSKADGGACVRLDKSTGKFWMKLYTRGQLRSAFAMFNKLLEYWHLEHRRK